MHTVKSLCLFSRFANGTGSNYSPYKNIFSPWVGDWRNGWSSDFHCNLSLLFTLRASNRTTIYYIGVNTGHPSFLQITQWPTTCLDHLFTGRITHPLQFDNVYESRPETIFTKFSSCAPCTTGRKRAVVNANKLFVLFWRHGAPIAESRGR